MSESPVMYYETRLKVGKVLAILEARAARITP